MSELEPTRSQFLVYQDDSGATRIHVRFDHETVWLAQAQLAQLFGTTQQNISLHIQSGTVIDEGELDAARTVRDLRTVRRIRTHKDYLTVRSDAEPTFNEGPQTDGQQGQRNARASVQKADPGNRPVSVRHPILRATVSTIGKRWRLLEEAGDGAL